METQDRLLRSGLTDYAMRAKAYCKRCDSTTEAGGSDASVHFIIQDKGWVHIDDLWVCPRCQTDSERLAGKEHRGY